MRVGRISYRFVSSMLECQTAKPLTDACPALGQHVAWRSGRHAFLAMSAQQRLTMVSRTIRGDFAQCHIGAEVIAIRYRRPIFFYMVVA